MKHLLTTFLLLAFITACNNKHTPEIPEAQATNNTIDTNKTLVNFDTNKMKRFGDCWYVYTYGNTDNNKLSRTELLQFQDLAIQIPFTSININALNQADTTVFETRGSLYSTLRIKYDMADTNYLSKLIDVSGYTGHISTALPNNAYPEEYYKLIPFKEQDTDTIVVTVLNRNYDDPRQMTEYYFTKKQNIWGIFKKIDTHFSPKTLAENKDEQLDKFLLRFASDSSFHLNRIKFPLEMHAPLDCMFDTTMYIEKKLYGLDVSAFNNSWFSTNHKNMQLKEVDNVILMRGETFGVQYYFKKINKQWFLYKEIAFGC